MSVVIIVALIVAMVILLLSGQVFVKVNYLLQPQKGQK